MIIARVPSFAFDHLNLYGGYADLFPHDEDAAGDPSYYGYLSPDGKWLIMKRDGTGASTTYRFACGTSGYTTNFTNRAALTFTYLNLMGA